MKIKDNQSQLRAVAVVSVWAILLTAVAATATADVINCGWRDSFSTSVVDDDVKALAVFDDGTGDSLYVGGYFTTIGGLPVNHIARWDGAAWSVLDGPFDEGVDGAVLALAVFNDGSGDALYAGGHIASAGGVQVEHIAKWNGTSWSQVTGIGGGGPNGAVLSLAVYNDGGGNALYAGGMFTRADGILVYHVAKWDGIEWSGLSGPSGIGVDGNVHGLAVYDDGTGDALYATGPFPTAGGVTVNRIAKWDGAEWSALTGPSGTGLNNYANALSVYDDGGGDALYVGGYFTTAGGVTVNRIARWDGASWSALTGPADIGVNSEVFALTTHNDGGGDAHIAAGAFFAAGGVTVNYIARWDGTSWSALDGPYATGMSSFTRALASDDAVLFAGGSFHHAGGVTSWNVAEWSCDVRIFSDGFESGGTTLWSGTTP